jgi:hypothetical protein
MKKKAVLLIAGVIMLCGIAAAVIFLLGTAPKEAPSSLPSEQAPELTPEQKLVGTWIQTQEHLDYENEHIHSASVTVTERESLVFNQDGTCALSNLYEGTQEFSYECRDGAVILMANGWAPTRYLIEESALLDPELGIAKYTKQ